MKSGANTYKTQAVMTASPLMLVAMLYDRAIQLLKEAVQAIEDGDINARWKANNGAREIIQHLFMTLNREKGGEIASNLDRLYRFIMFRLPQVDIRNDPKPALDAISVLEPLRAAWHEAARRRSAAAPPPSAPGEPGQRQSTSLSA